MEVKSMRSCDICGITNGSGMLYAKYCICGKCKDEAIEHYVNVTRGATV